jgi:MFS family permease
MAATLGSAAMLGQALGKIFLGFVADRSIILSIGISMTCGVIGMLMLLIMANSPLIIYAAGFIFGIFYASALVMPPLIARTAFGIRDFDKIYSRISMVSALISAISVSAWGFIIDGTGGYTFVWIIVIAIAVVCFFSFAAALNAGKKLEKTEV